MNRTSFLFAMILIAAIIFVIVYSGSIDVGGGMCSENYSPYRRTGDCPSATGWTYLDEYEQQDYYKKYPYVYPTSPNYIKAWYKNKREEDAFLEEERKKMKKAVNSLWR